MFTDPPQAPHSAASGVDVLDIVDTLRACLADLMGCAPHEIDARVPFPLLGLDSILGAELVDAVNRLYGLDERAVILYDHPCLAAMAAYIAHRGQAPDAGRTDRPAAAHGDGRTAVEPVCVPAASP